jgi:glutamate-5-semialdehyde dehydrogenase
MITLDKNIDLIIPRGGSALIEFVNKNSSVPIVKHDKGVCHIFVDKYADIKKATDILINAKTRRTGVCNAMECMIIHNDIANTFLPMIQKEFDKKSTILKGCENTLHIIDIQKANDEDFYNEYLANILNIKIVKDIDEAIEHIEKYGSSHSDAIISENYTNTNKFCNLVDSACVYVNTSTAFTDGGEFGFGAEVGISTNKLHSRGPMGIEDLTTYKFKILGNGQIRK